MRFSLYVHTHAITLSSKQTVQLFTYLLAFIVNIWTLFTETGACVVYSVENLVYNIESVVYNIESVPYNIESILYNIEIVVFDLESVV